MRYVEIEIKITPFPTLDLSDEPILLHLRSCQLALSIQSKTGTTNLLRSCQLLAQLRARQVLLRALPRVICMVGLQEGKPSYFEQ